MKELILKFFGFWRGVLSESDGSPSASRLIMLGLSVVASYVVVLICRSMVGMDATRAGLFLQAFPWIVGALAGFIIAPYSVNRGSNFITEILQTMKKKDQ